MFILACYTFFWNCSSCICYWGSKYLIWRLQRLWKHNLSFLAFLLFIKIVTVTFVSRAVYSKLLLWTFPNLSSCNLVKDNWNLIFMKCCSRSLWGISFFSFWNKKKFSVFLRFFSIFAHNESQKAAWRKRCIEFECKAQSNYSASTCPQDIVSMNDWKNYDTWDW